MIEISSRTNAMFKRWASLLEARGIKREDLAIVSGTKLVAERLAQDPAGVVALLYPPNFAGAELEVNRGVVDVAPVDGDAGLNCVADFYPAAETKKGSFSAPRAYRLSSELFRELDLIGTRRPLAIVRAPKLGDWSPGQAPRGLEIVLALSDPGNLGAALRSAEAFGASRVILAKESASVYLPKSLRAAAGATWRLPLVRTGSIHALDFGGASAVGLDMSGEDIRAFKFPADMFLVLGEEGRGLPKVASQSIKIAMHGRTESLNALAAFSIALFAYRAQHTD